MYATTSELHIILEPEDILKLIREIMQEDADFFLNSEIPKDFEGTLQKIDWHGDKEMIVTLS